MPVSLPTLNSLPEGAGYSARQGQASLDVRRKGDTIFISANCDSLQVVAEEYLRKWASSKEEVNRLRSELTETKTKTPSRTITVILSLLGTIFGCIVGWRSRK